MKKLKILVIILLLIMMTAFTMAIRQERAYVPPPIIKSSPPTFLPARTITVEIPPKTITVETPPKTITVEIPLQTVYSNDFNFFTSYAELRAWLDAVRPEIRAAAQLGWTCQDFAWWLFERAIEDGYLMAYQGIRMETYNAAFAPLKVDGAHAINSTYINNHTYLIEPQGLIVFPEFEIE